MKLSHLHFISNWFGRRYCVYGIEVPKELKNVFALHLPFETLLKTKGLCSGISGTIDNVIDGTEHI